MTMDYCRQFGIEPEYASICYVEKLLLSNPAMWLDGTATVGYASYASDGTRFSHDFNWLKPLRKIVGVIRDEAILGLVREILRKLNEVEYEKIKYVCSWLIDALVEEGGRI